MCDLLILTWIDLASVFFKPSAPFPIDLCFFCRFVYRIRCFKSDQWLNIVDNWPWCLNKRLILIVRILFLEHGLTSRWIYLNFFWKFLTAQILKFVFQLFNLIMISRMMRWWLAHQRLGSLEYIKLLGLIWCDDVYFWLCLVEFFEVKLGWLRRYWLEALLRFCPIYRPTSSMCLWTFFI